MTHDVFESRQERNDMQHTLNYTAAEITSRLNLDSKSGSWCQAEVEALLRLADVVQRAMTDKRVTQHAKQDTLPTS